jgi:hypothetical protein
MSFRKDKTSHLKWRKWLARCQPLLVLCGIPEDAYETQQNWWYFLDHARMSNGKESHWFSLDQLSHDQIIRLSEFLEQEYGSEEYPPFLLELVRSVYRNHI